VIKIIYYLIISLFFLLHSFHAHTLTLYAALCYQSNYRAAHVLCQHVDQKQLLYAIRAEYMSGPLRQGFYDLLIALHLESHATTMEVGKNEYIIPLGKYFENSSVFLTWLIKNLIK